MSVLLAVVALALLALVGARFGFQREGAPDGLRLFLASGSHFLVAGYRSARRRQGSSRPTSSRRSLRWWCSGSSSAGSSWR